MSITSKRRARLLLSTVVATALGLSVGASAQDLTVSPRPLHATDIGTLGGHGALALAIGANGLIVGTDVDDGPGRRRAKAFVAAPGRQPIAIVGSRAVDVNERGLVAGTTYGTSSRAQPFLWSEAEGRIDLPNIPSGRRDQGVGVDRAGRVVVNSSGTSGLARVFIVTPETHAQTQLPSLPNLHAIANGVSPAGAVVGQLREVIETDVNTPNIVNERPVYWDAESWQLHELPVSREPDGRVWGGEANGMNDAGTIVGTLWLEGRTRVVAWTGENHALRILSEGGRGNAVNAHDVVAGSVPQPDLPAETISRDLPRLWDLRNGKTIELAGLASAPDDVYDAEAYDIDDRGVAVGRLSTTADGTRISRAVVFERYDSQ